MERTSRNGCVWAIIEMQVVAVEDQVVIRLETMKGMRSQGITCTMWGFVISPFGGGFFVIAQAVHHRGELCENNRRGRVLQCGVVMSSLMNVGGE